MFSIFSDVTFSNFGTRCGKNDYVITTSDKVEDTQHPIDISQVTLHNVVDDNKIWIKRPNLGCVIRIK